MIIGEFVVALGMLTATIALVFVAYVLVVVTRKLSESAYRQTEILSENQRIAAIREQPNLIFNHDSYSVGQTVKDTHKFTHFDGFTVVNAGAIDITRTSVGATFTIRPNEPNEYSMQSIGLAPK